jgi:porphobilinogen synthase
VTFPIERLRRLRQSAGLRRLRRETRLSLDGIIEPLFACPGSKVRREIASMPGCAQMSVDVLVEECKRSFDLGIPSVLLFGIPETKDATGSSGTDPKGIVPRAIAAIKTAVPDLVVWADVCMCEYTDHGHCGIIVDGDVDNDATLELLARAAVAYANAGADGVAPSDMMDGRVAAIRAALDDSDCEHVPIMSYACKFASAFYGPFRDAAGSTPQFGNRSTYQMECGNGREALHEMELDMDEGADILMVKPGLAYLDIIRAARERFDVPIAAYNVSGEYSMVKAAAANGWLDHDRVVTETMTAFKRAGADIVLTYFARDLARILTTSPSR